MDGLADLKAKEEQNAELVQKAANTNICCVVCGIPSGVYNKNTGKGVTLERCKQAGFTDKYICQECKAKIAAIRN